MSDDIANQDLNSIAQQAERDLNSKGAQDGSNRGASDSTNESGVDESVTSKFPGSTVTYGSAASGGGNNRDIPESEGGGQNPATGQTYKASDFEGSGGPEDKARQLEETQPGSDDVQSNVR